MSLIQAIRACDINRTELLIQEGRNQLNSPIHEIDNDNGYTPLHVACLRDNAEIVSKLIKAGCDINKADKDGRTPLYIVCCSDNNEILSLLIRAGADINPFHKNKRVPLLAACQWGNVAAVLQLIAAGVDVNTREPCSPLRTAWISGKKYIAHLLIQAGADVFIDMRPEHHNTLVSDLIKKAQRRVLESFLLISVDPIKSHMFFDRSHFDMNVIGVVFSFLKN